MRRQNDEGKRMNHETHETNERKGTADGHGLTRIRTKFHSYPCHRCYPWSRTSWSARSKARSSGKSYLPKDLSFLSVPPGTIRTCPGSPSPTKITPGQRGSSFLGKVEDHERGEIGCRQPGGGQGAAFVAGDSGVA